MKKNRNPKSNPIFKDLSKRNINHYLKRRPVKRTAFHRIGCRKQ